MTSRVLLTRALRVLVAAMLLVTISSGMALAKNPNINLKGTATAVPGTVSAGALVRYDVAVTNVSNSNYSSFFVDAVTPDKTSGGQLVAVLVNATVTPTTTAPKSCDITSSGDLHCAFGPLNGSGSTASFSVLYRVPSNATGSWTVTFAASSNGFSNSDPGNSHGDAVNVPGTVSIGSGNNAGSYIFGDDTVVQNNQNLSKKNNPQSAKLDFTDSTESNFGATVSEAATTSCPTGITTCYGDLVIMSVKGGQAIGGGFLATIGYFSVPGSATGRFIHWDTSDLTGTYDLIDTSCADAAPGEACIDGTFKTGGNTFYVIRLFDNGPMRGI